MFGTPMIRAGQCMVAALDSQPSGGVFLDSVFRKAWLVVIVRETPWADGRRGLGFTTDERAE